MNPQPSRVNPAALSALPDTLASVAQCNDPLLLASVIERNRAVINDGWKVLERLTLQLETLNAREARIVQDDLNGADAIKISPPDPSGASG